MRARFQSPSRSKLTVRVRSSIRVLVTGTIARAGFRLSSSSRELRGCGFPCESSNGNFASPCLGAVLGDRVFTSTLLWTTLLHLNGASSLLGAYLVTLTMRVRVSVRHLDRNHASPSFGSCSWSSCRCKEPESFDAGRSSSELVPSPGWARKPACRRPGGRIGSTGRQAPRRNRHRNRRCRKRDAAGSNSRSHSCLHEPQPHRCGNRRHAATATPHRTAANFNGLALVAAHVLGDRTHGGHRNALGDVAIRRLGFLNWNLHRVVLHRPARCKEPGPCRSARPARCKER